MRASTWGPDKAKLVGKPRNSRLRPSGWIASKLSPAMHAGSRRVPPGFHDGLPGDGGIAAGGSL